MHVAALALLTSCVEARDGVDHLSEGPLHVLGQLHVIALLVYQVPKPFATHGDPYLELVSSGKEVIHVLCAVEAPVHDEMHLRHAKLGKSVQQVLQRLHVADVPRKLPVVDRKHALLAEEQGEVDLWEILAVTVVAVLDVLVESGVGGDTGDVEAQILGLRPVPQPGCEEGLALVLVQAGQKLADALCGEHATRWVPVGLCPFGKMAQGVATAHEVVGHGEHLPGGVRKAPVEYLAKTLLPADGVEDKRWPDDRRGRSDRRVAGDDSEALGLASVGDELPGGRIELADAALLVVRLLPFFIPGREHLVDVGGPVGMLVFDPVWFACVFHGFHGYSWNLFSHERQEEQSVNS